MRLTSRLLHWLLAGCVAAATVIGVPLAAHAQGEPVHPEIVNGEPVSITEVPWQVALLSTAIADNSEAQFCGGSIIGERWVVTAAHCVTELEGAVAPAASIQVLAGVTALDTPATGSRTDVAAVVVHPDYDSWGNVNDIALLRLAGPLDLSGPTRDAIALPTQSPSLWPAAGTDATISGWGATASGEPGTVDLQGATVDVLTSPTDPACGSYGTGDAPTYDPATMLCAGAAVAHVTDTCQGDSGGPLAIDDGGTWTLAGVTSFGLGCADPDYPGVYARVTTYTAWIDQMRAETWRTVTGSVSSTNGAVATGAVSFHTNCSTWPISRARFTGASYEVVVPEGDYRVRIEPDNGTGALSSWHNAQASCDAAGSVSISDYPDPHPARDLVALPGSDVTGSVSSGRGTVAAGQVQFYASCDDFESQTYTALANFEGAYTVTVPDGTYKIHIAPDNGQGAIDSWHRAAGSCAAADTVTVSGGRSADLEALPGSNLSGSVTSAAGPIGEGSVAFYDDCAAWATWDLSGWGVVEGDSSYAATVPDGTYLVHIHPALVASTAEESWHNAKSTCEEADVVTVSGDSALNLVAVTSAESPSPSPSPSASPGETEPPEPEPTESPTSASPTISPTPAQRAAQSLAKTTGKSRKGKKVTLAARTQQGQPVTWRSATKKVCTVKGTKVKTRKKGKCRLTAAALGSATLLPFSGTFTIRVK